MAGKKNSKSLANLKPFKPGQSGNPAGAPKGKRWRTILHELLEMDAIVLHEDKDKEILEILEAKIGRQLSNRDVVGFNQILKARQGSTFAFRAIAEREEGRPAEENDEGAGGTYMDFLDSIPGDEE